MATNNSRLPEVRPKRSELLRNEKHIAKKLQQMAVSIQTRNQANRTRQPKQFRVYKKEFANNNAAKRNHQLSFAQWPTYRMSSER